MSIKNSTLVNNQHYNIIYFDTRHENIKNILLATHNNTELSNFYNTTIYARISHSSK